MKIVVAIGGNMISNASKKGESFEDQMKRTSQTASILVDLIEEGHSLVLTHGNGPQVGSLLLQQQMENNDVTSLPLNILGALTQGQIGVMLQHNLINEMDTRGYTTPVVIIPTSVIVDEDDPGFENPTKPVGPFFSEEEYSKLKTGDGEIYKKLPKGYRRVVPSPYPREILESEVINSLSASNIVIAVGGGGSPTLRKNGGIQLVDAVIDKDLASSLLARQINADALMILTNVDGVYKDFGRADQQLFSELTSEEAKQLFQNGQLGEGSMKPKVRAAMEFSPYGDTIITSPEKALSSLRGEAGTRILKSA